MMNTTQAGLTPIKNPQRIHMLDVIRGFALIGILFMNIEWFNRPDTDLLQFDYNQTGLDYGASWLVKVFVEGKFYKLFSLLFGMGFAVMLIRAQEAGRPFGAWFTRRMSVLFIIGMAHLIFLWGGDILHDYAVAGMLLLGFVYLLRWQKLSKFNTPTAFAKTGFSLMLLPFVVGIVGGIGYGVSHDHQKITDIWQENTEIEYQVNQRIEQEKSTGSFLLSKDAYEALNKQSEGDDEIESDATETSVESLQETNTQASVQAAANPSKEQSSAERIAENIDQKFERKQKSHYRSMEETRIFTEGNYWQATQHRWDKALRALGNTPFFALFVCLPIFMVGYWLVASKRIQQHEKHQRFFNTLCYGGLFFGLALNISGVFISLHPATKAAREIQAVGGNLFFLGQYVLCAGYLGLLVKIHQKAWFEKVFSWLAPLGKMALTNYIMHSVIFTTLFYGYGAGLFGQIERSQQMLLVIITIALQAIISALWLKYFTYGPLEWLWRSMTYMKRQPMVK
ncbi:DUF418 domain-containing protein [Thalassotalea sediminis]|uniref:DUF418 domain-containing protein n=1 Tax=Thalassotalea sediminis TaxID=1759089 RepID=UPI00257304EB|nr:DUF418 domain-containing protein [Thalassotalea sediminis]